MFSCHSYGSQDEKKERFIFDVVVVVIIIIIIIIITRKRINCNDVLLLEVLARRALMS
jgi:hypothetical protein